MSMLEARGAFGANAHVSEMWITRFIQYCASQFGDNMGGKKIQRAPRAQGQLRAKVEPMRIARYLFRVYRLFDTVMPRWVTPYTTDTEPFDQPPRARNRLIDRPRSRLINRLTTNSDTTDTISIRSCCRFCSSMRLAGLGSTAWTSRLSSAWRKRCTAKRSHGIRIICCN